GITPQQFWVLLVLHGEDGLSLHALADRVWADDPTACRIISRLAEQKLVRAESDPHDRRRFRLRLTPKGKKLGAELAALQAEALHAAQARQPQIEAARAQVRAGQARVGQARAGFLPRLDGSFQYQRSTANFVVSPAFAGSGLNIAINNRLSPIDTVNYYLFGV